MTAETGRDEQLHVVPAQASAMQLLRFDEIETLLSGPDQGSRQTRQISQRLGALVQIPAGQLA